MVYALRVWYDSTTAQYDTERNIHLNEQEEKKETVILVGCQLPHVTDEHFDHSMDELASLTKTADGTVLTRITQKRNRADAATYIGS